MFIVIDWIQRHCAVPDGFRAGDELVLYRYQFDFLTNFYLVRGDARWVPDAPVLAPSFVYRRGILIGPQKLGKNPLVAAQICAEAEGPVVFAGWASRDDGYACIDYGCGCGWEYAYDPGEPMGMPWPTPLIQITAFSEDQTDNTYDVLRPMIEKGRLADLIPHTGESFIRLRGANDQARIETVTSSAQSRLGARATFVPQDQLEQWWPSNGMTRVADTQYRNLAGTGGRAVGLANAWDPSQNSVAQREFESKKADVYRQATWAPHALDFSDPNDRRRIFEAVYPPDVLRENGGHLDLDAIEPEAVAILAYDPPQARRFFANEIVEGQGKAFNLRLWNDRAVQRPKVVPDGALIVIGIDGSVDRDHFPVIGTEVASGYQWPLGIWVPGGPGHDVPMHEVDQCLLAAFDRWNVWRLAADPPYIESWLATWIGRWGEDRVVKFVTGSPKQMAVALRAWRVAMERGELEHCATSDPFCDLFTQHVGNAVRRDTGYRDDEGFLWTIEKERPGGPLKIDGAVAATISWDARTRAIAAGALNVQELVSAYSDENWIVAGKPRSLLS